MIDRFVIVGMLLAAGGWSQTGTPLSFEVASVKAAAGPWRESKTGVDRIDFPSVSLRYCLAYAYGVKEYQISGPSWLAELRYELSAKGPPGTRPEQLPDMMQTLLAQRFGIALHRETREFNVFVLEPGKNGHKLREQPADAAGASFGMSTSASGLGRLEGRNATMASLAATLIRILGQPVLDRTGLTGRYDFELEFTREEAGGMRTAAPADRSLQPNADPGASLFTSIQQLGLKLSARKVPLDAIVIDRAEKTPTGN